MGPGPDHLHIDQQVACILHVAEQPLRCLQAPRFDSQEPAAHQNLGRFQAELHSMRLKAYRELNKHLAALQTETLVSGTRGCVIASGTLEKVTAIGTLG